jgi:transposase
MALTLRSSPRSRPGWTTPEVDLLELLSVDSTSVRAHQHAAGARPARHTGGQSNYTKYPDELDDHAIGRSRGGLTTKTHALGGQSCSPVPVVFSAGQAGDNPMLSPMLEERKAASTDRFRLLGDKAYSHDSTRVRLRQMKIAQAQRSDRPP